MCIRGLVDASVTASRGVTNVATLSLELVGLVVGDVERERLAWHLDGFDELRKLDRGQVGDVDLRRKGGAVSEVGRQVARFGHYLNCSISELCQGRRRRGFAGAFDCSEFTW